MEQEGEACGARDAVRRQQWVRRANRCRFQLHKEDDRQPDCLSPAGVFLVAVSLRSCAVLERVVVGQAMVTF